MPIIIVEVMPKAELLDPQGKAVAGALARTGASHFTGVRIGKRFELSFDGEADAAALAEARELADSLLSNSVIEDVVSVHFVGSDASENTVTSGNSVAEPGPTPAGSDAPRSGVAAVRVGSEAPAAADDSLAAVPDGHA